MSTANCDWQITVQKSQVKGDWFVAALLPGPFVTGPGNKREFKGNYHYTPWLPTELAARTAIEAILAMEG